VLGIANIFLAVLQKKCNGFLSYTFRYSFPSSWLRQQNQWRRGQTKLPVSKNLRHASRGAVVAPIEPDSSISSIFTIDDDGNRDGSDSGSAKFSTESTDFSLRLPSANNQRRKLSWKSLRRKILFWREGRTSEVTKKTIRKLNFSYEYDVIEFPIATTANDPAKLRTTTGILLIHPIGVGIARWYYQRLVKSLVTKQSTSTTDGTRIHDNGNQQIKKHRVVLVVPDLLGSGSACNATISKTTIDEDQDQTVINERKDEIAKTFPLFNISDWTDQLESLMLSMESSSKIDQWCVVANGGCSPIALQLGERKQLVQSSNKVAAVTAEAGGPVSNLILSSVPRLPFFLKNETTNDPEKVLKSFRTLSGIAGNLFWWYACRKNGAFIQTFSEKNLIADSANLGPFWRPNCYQTAISFDGRGKYATFTFLAGTLQDGCLPSLDAVKHTPLQVDIIKGADVRRNRAKSWFWQKPKHKKKEGDIEDKMRRASNSKSVENEENGDSVSTVALTEEKSYETFRDYIQKNGNGGREIVIGGRISLAHEDSDGYANAILNFLFSNITST